MNHCLLEVEVINAPTVRYTKDNKTPVAEMAAKFNGLRPDDASGEIKVVGWGNLAQELQNNIKVGQKLVLEGRLRMNTAQRQDGTKEKRAEFTLTKYHYLNSSDTRKSPIRDSSNQSASSAILPQQEDIPQSENGNQRNVENPSWDSSPLIPDTDDIPF